MNPSIESAITTATTWHKNQIDKGGQPYILHPLRVMLRFTDPIDRLIAVLHDIVEDTPVTFHALTAAGFDTEAVDAIQALTRDPKEPYFDYIERVAKNPRAVRVKIADLQDNLAPERSENISVTTRCKYETALEYLIEQEKRTQEAQD